MLNHLIPLDVAPESQPDYRFAHIPDTSHTFLVSALLWDHARRKVSPEASIVEQFNKEVRRVEALGFWPRTRAPGVSSPHSTGACLQETSLHLTHGCNLSCTYCNVQKGTYGDSFSLMDIDTAKASIDLLLTSKHLKTGSGADNKDVLKLVLYGGEPLLNWATLEVAVTAMREAVPKSDIVLVTNGILLTAERASFLAEQKVFTIISLDGPPTTHDHNRPAADGTGTYDKVLSGLDLLRKVGALFHIRGTWLPGGESYEDVLTHLIDLAGDYRQVTLGLCFEAALGNRVEDYNRSLTTLFAAARTDVTRLPSVAFDVLDRVLRPQVAVQTKCSAGRTGVSITPQGDIYPCQVSVSRKAYRLGNVHDDQGCLDDRLDVLGRKKREDFLSIASDVCDTCWAQVYCPGPCPYAVPIPGNWSFCRTMKHQIREVLNFCATMPSTDLLHLFLPPSVAPTAESSSAPVRGAALRDIIWTANRHIKPLAIAPLGGSKQ